MKNSDKVTNTKVHLQLHGSSHKVPFELFLQSWVWQSRPLKSTQVLLFHDEETVLTKTRKMYEEALNCFLYGSSLSNHSQQKGCNQTKKIILAMFLLVHVMKIWPK